MSRERAADGLDRPTGPVPFRPSGRPGAQGAVAHTGGPVVAE
ncbi:hypothetical protein PA8380_33940 [Pseudomonas aeruginosa]|nr:hypothetical protein PA8380_33940 [Pseudomonas aeruginosa]